MTTKKSTNTNNKGTPGHSRQTSLKKPINPTDDSDDEN
jgi:hypothetical protein